MRDEYSQYDVVPLCTRRSIRHLREASQTDGKAARNMQVSEWSILRCMGHCAASHGMAWGSAVLRSTELRANKQQTVLLANCVLDTPLSVDTEALWTIAALL
jgi:hypothetical protein